MSSKLHTLVIRSALVGVMVLAMTGIYYRVKIAPLWQRQAEIKREIALVRGHLSAAQKEIGDIKGLEQERWRFRQHLNALHQDSPLAPAVAWLPERMKSRLASHGVTEAEVRLNMIEPKSRIGGFDRSYWHVGLPAQNGARKMTDALLAIAQLEQQDRFVKIIDLSLCTQAGEGSWTGGNVNVTAFVRR